VVESTAKIYEISQSTAEMLSIIRIIIIVELCTVRTTYQSRWHGTKNSPELQALIAAVTDQ